MRCFGDVFEKTSTSMFLTMFFKTPNIVPTMHLTMLIAHPYLHLLQRGDALLYQWVGVRGYPPSASWTGRTAPSCLPPLKGLLPRRTWRKTSLM